ncbi:MAG: S26 family signal peptidase [Fibrobacter sp.]|nr:peptidase [Fibrobacter sp.]MCR5378889.1 S26 family signal peptidase [Fibrobacter sp.]
MRSLKHTVKKLQRMNSQSHVFFLVFVLVLAFAVALLARHYVFEPLKMTNNSMYPRHKENSFLWVCKLPQCIDQVKKNETVWAELRNHETLVRRVIAMPGDTLHISDKGFIKSGKFRTLWRGENAFIESRDIYVPKKGDTLHFDALNDVEQDYAITLLHEQGVNFHIKTTLWQGEREINIDRVGSTKLSNRQVSLQEINVLPWQDRRLIEMQIRQSEPGNSPIKLRRELLHEADSSLINEIVVEDDCYFLACLRGNHCVDSRETGYFTKERLLGRYVEFPDKVKAFIQKKAKTWLTSK